MLIVDTSSSEPIVAIAKEGALLLEKKLPQGAPLSKFLIPTIEELLAIHAPSSIAVGIGPGTFTGTRVGATIAQTLTYAMKLPLLTFPSTKIGDLSILAQELHSAFQARNFATTPLPLIYNP
jgi:tRNA threonylcarbamoyladenosine biosynthesis protein TsaB